MTICRSSPICGPGPISKWTAINRTMRAKHLGILCLQETHLSNEYTNQVDSLFTKQLLVYNSPDPDCPNISAGVIIIINKKLINPDATKQLSLSMGAPSTFPSPGRTTSTSP
jgi:hypothetical protein